MEIVLIPGFWLDGASWDDVAAPLRDALIKEIVAAGGQGREVLLKLGGRLVKEFRGFVRHEPGGALGLQRAGAFWRAILAGFAQNDERSNRVRGLLAETVGSVASSFGPPGVQIVAGLVVTPSLRAVFGSANETDKRKAAVLAAAYPSILLGILESRKGAGFRRVHPELFRGNGIDLDDVLKVLSSPNADHGGPSDDVRQAADKALATFLNQLGGSDRHCPHAGRARAHRGRP